MRILSSLVAVLVNSVLMTNLLALPAIDQACHSDQALSTCLQPQEKLLVPEEHNGQSRYVAASVRYFLTMKSDQNHESPIATDSTFMVSDYLRPLDAGEWNPINKWFSQKTIHPRYSDLVVRYEFPPWLLTTGFGVVTMKNVDEVLRLYTTDYKKIECRFFDRQPFGRCHVVFLYGEDDLNTVEDERAECPIYEEFTFNDAGKITFIEAWTDHDGSLPMHKEDYWAEADDVKRLSTWIPGLGSKNGTINPSSETFKKAAKAFDNWFQAPYWNHDEHNLGPFTGMMQEIDGKGLVEGTLSFWPR